MGTERAFVMDQAVASAEVSIASTIMRTAPEWAVEAARSAAAATPTTSRTSTAVERLSSARAWRSLAADPRLETHYRDWALAVRVQALTAIYFCLELDTLDDFTDWATAAELLVARIKTTPVDVAPKIRARAHSMLAIYLDFTVEMSLTADPLETLKSAAVYAESALNMPGDDAPAEAIARRYNVLAIIARKLARRAQGIEWWDISVNANRASAGLDPNGSDCEVLPETPRSAPAVELATRWQNLANAYRSRGAALGSITDLENAVAAADQALRFAPLGDPARGGPWMARANALMSLADHVDAPIVHVRNAVDAFRHAVELPSSGAARRQKRLTSLGQALRRLHSLSASVDDKQQALLSESIMYLARAVRLTRPGSEERPRLAANLANALRDRARIDNDLREWRRAIRWYRRALALSRAQPRSAGRDIPHHEILLAAALEIHHRPAGTLNLEAEQLFRSALAHAADLDVALYVRSARRFARALTRYDRTEDAIAVLLAAIEHLGAATDPRLQAQSLQLRCEAAELLAVQGEVEVALATVGCALDHAIVLLPGLAEGAVLHRTMSERWTLIRSTALTWDRLRFERDRLQHRYRSGDTDRPSLSDVESAIAYCRSVFSEIGDSSAPVPFVATGPALDLPFNALIGSVSRSLSAEPPAKAPPTEPDMRAVRASFARHPHLSGSKVEQSVMRRILGNDLTVRETLPSTDEPPADLCAPILHIAAHGGEIDGQPALSLAPDTWVVPSQLQNLRISPILVLTVCPTAYRHDAPYPPRRIQDNLLTAGAHLVISPLWPVRDAAAAAFTAGFYQYLQWNDLGRSPIDAAAAAVERSVADMRSSTVHEFKAAYPELSILPALNEPADSRPFDHPRDYATWRCWS
ncbi:CHAT domain-containing protein [Nocardia nova]|uniref:CHAT domain-containing protein n=1 Tax=Nocardia nova TaxID=37330 RepID=UPI0015E2E515|nr:CHAT domain-containing protein [Nocardia nova]